MAGTKSLNQTVSWQFRFRPPELGDSGRRNRNRQKWKKIWKNSKKKSSNLNNVFSIVLFTFSMCVFRFFGNYIFGHEIPVPVFGHEIPVPVFGHEIPVPAGIDIKFWHIPIVRQHLRCIYATVQRWCKIYCFHWIISTAHTTAGPLYK